ncbi:TetR/AcrR family transcriptional regulator [Agromyces silvae]|uniref:TetR/AcrR family transcriptional regulator n=1 Tax=Agromyces silvae TaxID=3388266 RepID=UPI00280AAD00|nr:TetR/AcrR family transcriptional regulator [Agromyces protaetiae]
MPRPLVPDRRRRILDAARELILEQGWPETTVAQLATRAGIGKGAVYLEFADKPAILDAVLQRSLRGLTAQVHARVVDAPGLVDLPALYRFGVEALLDEPLMLALYVGDERVLGSHVQGVDDERYLTRMVWLGDYVLRLQRAGVIDATIDADSIVRVLSVFTVGLIHAPGLLGAVSPARLRESVELFADLVGRGLATGLPADPDAARAAQLTLIERLGAQLDAAPLDAPEDP